MHNGEVIKNDSLEYIPKLSVATFGELPENKLEPDVSRCVLYLTARVERITAMERSLFKNHLNSQHVFSHHRFLTEKTMTEKNKHF